MRFNQEVSKSDELEGTIRMKKALVNISGRTNAGPAIALELAKALAKNGYVVYAIVSADALNLQDWLKEELLEHVFILKTYTNWKNIFKYSLKFYFFEKRKIKKFYSEIVFDFVFKPMFHVWSDEIIAQINTKKVITICHDPIMHSGESIIKKIVYPRYIRKSDEVVVLTKSFIDIIYNKYRFAQSKVHYMPLGLMTMYKEKQNHDIPSLYSEDKINFVFFGRIERYKGINVLLKAYQKLSYEFKNISLTIAGKGKIDEFLPLLNSMDSVMLINKYIPDEEVGIYFDGPNIVTILPYLDATQSGVIPIAMEYGSLIVASNTGGLKEQMMNGLFGLYVNAGDIDDLYRMMKEIIMNPSIFSQQHEIMSSIINQLEWKEVVSKLLNEIRN